jgi:spoIIIJ-associated protein
LALMEKQPLERTGKTVDEAIELAILELGVGRDEVEVDVVSQGRGGILGIGSEAAKVRVSLITGSTAGASAALGVVNDLLDAMDVDATPTIRSSGSGPDNLTVIDIQGEDAGLIIGRRGETLRALQYIANIILGRREDDAGPIIVDVEQYRDRRQQQIGVLADRMAERAITSGGPVTLEVMSAADRRLVHVALADDKGVTTESSGEGMQRRVTITPTGERPARPSPRGGGTQGPRRSSDSGDSGGTRGSNPNAGNRRSGSLSEYRPNYRDDRD